MSLKASTSTSSSVKLSQLPNSASTANMNMTGASLGGSQALSMLKEEEGSAAGDAPAAAVGGGAGGVDDKSAAAKAPSQSLLKVVLDDYRADKDRTSRLLLVGELESAYGVGPMEIKNLHTDFFSQFDPRDTKITGAFFCIGYQFPTPNSPQVFMHLLEAPSKVLYALLRLLNEDKQQAVAAAAAASSSSAAAGSDEKSGASSATASPVKAADPLHMSELDPPMSPPPLGSGGAAAAAAARAAAAGGGGGGAVSGKASGSTAKRVHAWTWMRSAKILSFSEEVPREYPLWFFRPAVRFASADEFARPSDFLQPCFSTLRHALELGRELQAMSDEKAQEYMLYGATRQFMQRIPTPAQIVCFGTCDDLCSIREYVDIYDAPIDFTLESEKVWPVEPFLKY